MIYLILSEEGFNELLQFADKRQDKLWLNSGIVSDEAVAASIKTGWQLNVFSQSIDANSEQSIVKAIKYLEKKWPDETIEVEFL